MLPRASLCFRGNSRRQMIGRGRTRMMKSETILADAFITRIRATGWQVPEMLKSQDLATGLHANIWINTWPICHAAMIAIRAT